MLRDLARGRDSYLCVRRFAFAFPCDGLFHQRADLTPRSLHLVSNLAQSSLSQEFCVGEEGETCDVIFVSSLRKKKSLPVIFLRPLHKVASGQEKTGDFLPFPLPPRWEEGSVFVRLLCKQNWKYVRKGSVASVRGGGGYWRVSPRHPVCQRDLRLNAFRNFFFFFFTETYLGNFIAPFQTHFMFKMHILCLITNACALALEEELQK